MSLHAVRFTTQLGAEFSEKYHVPLLNGHCFGVVFLGETYIPHTFHLTLLGQI